METENLEQTESLQINKKESIITDTIRNQNIFNQNSI